MPKKNIPKTQKIIVPKGTIDPTDDTVIEIPAGLYTQSVVVAKRKDANRTLPIFDNEAKSCQSSCSVASKTDPRTNINYADRSGNADVSHVSRVSQMPDLNETEYTEKEKVLRQLEDFQRARRKFLADTSAVANTSSGNLGSADQSRANLRDTYVRWGNTSTQTSPLLPPIHNFPATYTVPPPPILPRPEIRDSLEFSRIPMKMSKPSKRERKLNLPNYRNLEKKESSLIDLEDIDLSDSDSNEDVDLPVFAPPMNSTFTVKKKKESSCKTCCGKPSDDNIKPDHHRRRGDKPNSKRKKKTMEKTPSRTSEVSDGVSAKESCPATDCPHGSKKHDDSCAPCCKTKFSKKPSKTKSKSFMTDSDFEKIKEQLREARKKLDEAVAMVSRTVASSSSSYTAGRVTPETDASPTASYIINRRQKAPLDKPSKAHDSQKCVLYDKTDASNQSKTSRSKSATDNLLCLDSCSNMNLPPCVSSRDSKKSEDQHGTQSKTVISHSSNVSCTLLFPCEMPSVASGQSASHLSARSAKSLPTSSTKIEQDKPKINMNSRIREEERHSRMKESDARKTSTVCGSKEYKDRDLDTLCSTLCLNMHTPPCSVEEVLQKNAEQLENYLRRLSTKANTPAVPCERMFPCEIPSTVSRQGAIRQSGKSTATVPASSTRVSEMQQRSGVSHAKEEDNNGYLRFSDGIDRKKDSGGVCRASQTRGSDIYDLLCSSMCLNIIPPPCKSEEASFRRQTPPPPPPQQYAARSLGHPNATRVPCTPMFPCEIPFITSEEDRVCVAEKPPRSSPASYANMRGNEPRTASDSKSERDKRQPSDNEEKRTTRSSKTDAVEQAPVAIIDKEQPDMNSALKKDDKEKLNEPLKNKKGKATEDSAPENINKKEKNKKRPSKQNEEPTKNLKKGKKSSKSDEENIRPDTRGNTSGKELAHASTQTQTKNVDFGEN